MWSPAENSGWRSAIVMAPQPGCGKVPPEVMRAFWDELARLIRLGVGRIGDDVIDRPVL